MSMTYCTVLFIRLNNLDKASTCSSRSETPHVRLEQISNSSITDSTLGTENEPVSQSKSIIASLDLAAAAAADATARVAAIEASASAASTSSAAGIDNGGNSPLSLQMRPIDLAALFRREFKKICARRLCALETAETGVGAGTTVAAGVGVEDAVLVVAMVGLIYWEESMMAGVLNQRQLRS